MKKIIMIVVAVGVGVVAAKFLLQEKEIVENLSKPLTYLRSVKTVLPQEQTLEKTREFLAQLQASKSAFIASKFTAKIKKIYVHESDRVQKGDLLVSLDDSETKAALASLKEKKSALSSDLKSAKNILQRNKKLLAINAISQEAYDNSSVMYQTKRSALVGVEENIKQLNSQLRYLNLKAPFSGTIGEKLSDAGSLALGGKPLLTLNSNDQKLLFSFVDGDEPILVGQKVSIDAKLVGEVTKRYEDAKNSLLVAEVKPYKTLPFANKSYKSIAVSIESAKGCTLPIDTILHKRDASFIMLYRDKKFTAQIVDVLLQNEERVLISQCPTVPVAQAAEAKLSLLPSYGEVMINEDK